MRPFIASARIPTPGGNALIHACRGSDESKAEEITDLLLKDDWSLAVKAVDEGIALHAAAASGFPRVLVRGVKEGRGGVEGARRGEGGEEWGGGGMGKEIGVCVGGEGLGAKGG